MKPSLIQHTAIYMAANLAAALIGFASSAIFTRLYSPEDYGVYVVACGLGGILSAVFYTWVRLSVLRMQCGADDVRLTALGGYGASSAILALAVAVGVLGCGIPARMALGAASFAVTIGFFEMQLEILRANQRVARHALSTVTRAIAWLALGLAFSRAGLGGPGLVLAIALAFAAASALVARSAWRPPLAAIDRKAGLDMLRFGLPATLSGLTLALHAASDRLVVTAILGAAIGGQYGVAADFTRQIILVPAMALGSAIVPGALRALADGGPEAARRSLADAGEVMAGLLLPAIAGFALVGPALSSLVLGAPFREAAASLIPILSAVWLFQAISQNYIHAAFHLSGRSRGMVYHGFVALGANLALVPACTHWLGLRGAAGAIAAAEGIAMVAGFWFARRAVALPLEPRRIGRIAAAVAIMACAVLLARAAGPASPIPALLLQIGVGVLAYGLAVLGLDAGGVRTRLTGWMASRPST